MKKIKLAILRASLFMSDLSIAAADARGVFSPLQHKHSATLRGRISMLETQA